MNKSCFDCILAKRRMRRMKRNHQLQMKKQQAANEQCYECSSVCAARFRSFTRMYNEGKKLFYLFFAHTLAVPFSLRYIYCPFMPPFYSFTDIQNWFWWIRKKLPTAMVSQGKIVKVNMLIFPFQPQLRETHYFNV